HTLQAPPPASPPDCLPRPGYKPYSCRNTVHLSGRSLRRTWSLPRRCCCPPGSVPAPFSAPPPSSPRKNLTYCGTVIPGSRGPPAVGSFSFCLHSSFPHPPSSFLPVRQKFCHQRLEPLVVAWLQQMAQLMHHNVFQNFIRIKIQPRV